MRVRMRRRLIGAAALLLGTAVLVPMILDPAPKPLPDNIPIDIPSERTAFTPRLSLPANGPLNTTPVPQAGQGPVSAPAGGAGDGPGVGGAAAEAPGTRQTAPATAPNTPERKGAAADPEPSATAPTVASVRADAGRWFVQAAALSSEIAARQLSERLSKAGLSPFVERTDRIGNGAADGVLYRVRLGPFASHEAAVKARKHLHGLGVSSNLVRVEQAER
jgi:DedD protein